MIVPQGSNSAFDNAFMTGEQSYKYYNEFMWKGRYAECTSVAETIERIKAVRQSTQYNAKKNKVIHIEKT